MIRTIIRIDEEKCNGCGACASACHEGAIEIIDGKAKLTKENYCDGLGDCLPGCPAGAISFEEREAPAYDEEAVLKSKKQKAEKEAKGCPGAAVRQFNLSRDSISAMNQPAPVSMLSNWPVQIKLAPINAPYFNGAKLLVAADCSAYAYANMHEVFIKGRVCLIGCPKLDAIDYSVKLTEIIKRNDISSIHIVRMEVPCCGGLEYAVKTALRESGKIIPCQVTTISAEGKILD